MTERLRVATRASPLARAQTELALRSLRRADPRVGYEVVTMRTSGDRTARTDRTLDFTDVLDRALEAGEVDLAVHSTKDLPARPLRRVVIGAFLRRGDPRDCAILRGARRLRDLPRGARIGSSSLRRRAQLLAVRPDLEVVPIRGNVGTRLEKISSMGLDGVVLAAAGVKRLGWGERITELLPVANWLPSPGQGAIAIEVRAEDRATLQHVRAVDHARTRVAVEAERAVVAAAGGDCDLPLGAFGRIVGGELELRAEWFSEDGRTRVRAERRGPVDRPTVTGADVGRWLKLAAAPTARGLAPRR